MSAASLAGPVTSCPPCPLWVLHGGGWPGKTWLVPLARMPIPSRDCSCSPALCQHTLHPTRQDQPPEPPFPAPNLGAAGLAKSCASTMCPQEPGERVSLPSALGLAPQQAATLNFHHPWLKGSLRRSNPINPAQTSLCLMGKSQLTQG